MNLFYLYVGVSSLLIITLAFNVSLVRVREKVRNGDGGNKNLKIAINAHSNALEYILPFALMVFVLQAQGLNNEILPVIVFGFLVLRIMHALGMLLSIFRLWQVAAALSYGMSLTAAILIMSNLFSS